MMRLACPPTRTRAEGTQREAVGGENGQMADGSVVFVVIFGGVEEMLEEWNAVDG